MSPRQEYIETVITCEGDYYSPDFQNQLTCFRERLSSLIIPGMKIKFNNILVLFKFGNFFKLFWLAFNI